MKKILFIFFLSLQIAQAQKKNFTIQEAVNGMTTKFAIKNLSQLQWTGNSEYYTYLESKEGQEELLIYKPNNFESEKLFTLEELNNTLDQWKVKKLTTIPALNWINNRSFYIVDGTKYIGVQVNDHSPGAITSKLWYELPKDAEHSTVDKKQMNISYTQDNQLYIMSPEQKAVQVSRDGSKNILYGTSVHRDEFGITGGMFWSPLGNALAFYRMDQSMVEDYPVVDWSVTPAVVNTIKYPMAGRTSHQVTLGVYNLKNGTTVYMKTGEPKDQYLTSVTWSPDEKFIYIGILNRDQDHLRLNQYDAVTGGFIKTLFEEKSTTYVEPQHDLEFYNQDPTQFIWWSQRDGYMHLYLYKADGTLVKQLTKGSWIVNEFLGYSKKTGEIYFTASKESPLQKNIYAVQVTSGRMRNVSKTPGWHTGQLSQDGNYLIDVYSSSTIPRNIEVINLGTSVEKRLMTAPNTLEEYNMSRIDQVRLFASDSTELYGKLIYPPDFNENKKYPVIVYLYNGPHVQLNRESFPGSGNLWYNYMAQKGYLIFILDGRGSSNRGFAFESAVHRQLGTLEMEDQLKGVEFLKSLSFVDPNRLGIHGWSFGGFMTTAMMLNHPGVFKAAVAGGPVLDWSIYEVMYTERYMDTPEQNPEGYKNNLLIDKVKNLKGKLLMIHGTSDDVVVWQHSLKFLKKAVDEGVQVDYFVYPGHPHNVRGKDRVHLMQKVSDYFDLYLK